MSVVAGLTLLYVHAEGCQVIFCSAAKVVREFGSEFTYAVVPLDMSLRLTSQINDPRMPPG